MRELELMEAAARAGGRVLVDAFGARSSLEVSSKGPGDLVTEADLAAEQVIREVLEAADPEAAWCGEELGTRAGSSTREWVVDPLDGTTNFVCGIPHFCVSIALREAGETICAALLQPLTDELFTAAAGAGAWLDGELIHVSSRERWQRIVLATGIPHRGSDHHDSFVAELALVRDRVGGLRRFGAAAMDLAWVACGRFDGFWERGLHPWDVAAGNLLVREAGGLVTGLEREHDPDTGQSLLAASPWLHAQLRGLLTDATGTPPRTRE